MVQNGRGDFVVALVHTFGLFDLRLRVFIMALVRTLHLLVLLHKELMAARALNFGMLLLFLQKTNGIRGCLLVVIFVVYSRFLGVLSSFGFRRRNCSFRLKLVLFAFRCVELLAQSVDFVVVSTLTT